ncbi:MAG: M23 family metallopeptidase [Treponema sp.]|nr:M23 family metallopeptidase [Candidatus Treponema equifaecale]
MKLTKHNFLGFFSGAVIFSVSVSSIFSQEQKIQELNSADFTVLPTAKQVSPKGDEILKENNRIFRQYQKDIELNNKLKRIPLQHQKPSDFPTSFYYSYTVKADTDNYLTTFNGLSARLQISQGTLATVNSISSPELKIGQKLILPINQGLFIAKKPDSALEILMQNEYSAQIDTETTAEIQIDGRSFYFLPEKNFSGTDIAFFHDNSMILPLNKKVLTSPFGYRTSPISGKWTFHAGIDLASPLGSDVYACKSGLVTKVDYNSTYGNYIILLHNGGKTSLYAHLSKTLVKKDDRVNTGQVIGLVGTTGASTGPHLHFEVREKGNPTDPGKLIK